MAQDVKDLKIHAMRQQVAGLMDQLADTVANANLQIMERDETIKTLKMEIEIWEKEAQRRNWGQFNQTAPDGGTSKFSVIEGIQAVGTGD